MRWWHGEVMKWSGDEVEGWSSGDLERTRHALAIDVTLQGALQGLGIVMGERGVHRIKF